MPRRVLAVLMLLASVPAVAAEPSPPPVVKSAAEATPKPKQAAGAERKSVERKAGQPPKNPSEVQKARLPVLDEKNSGLGCAE
jgi:hypothetical protein